MNKTNAECPLFQKPECDLLNMTSCKDCPMRDESVRAHMKDDVRLFCELLPEGGLAPLFESESCTLCKDEALPADGYAILDMAHAEPKRPQRTGLLRLKKRRPVGFIAPVQFAVCPKCRARLLFLEYLPLLVPVLTTLIAIFLVANESILEKMKDVSVYLPLGTVAAAVLIGYLIGRLLTGVCSKAYDKKMYVNPMEHPFVRQMTDRGWFQLADQRKVRMVFTKKRIQLGLGSASGDAYRAMQQAVAAETPQDDPAKEI